MQLCPGLLFLCLALFTGVFYPLGLLVADWLLHPIPIWGCGAVPTVSTPFPRCFCVGSKLPAAFPNRVCDAMKKLCASFKWRAAL